MVQRLDIKSVRFDKLNQSVQINGRKVVLEIGIEALENLKQRELNETEAVAVVVQEAKRFTRLAERVPADDGKIHITTRILNSDGMFVTEDGG